MGRGWWEPHENWWVSKEEEWQLWRKPEPGVLSMIKAHMEEEDRVKETELNVKRCIRNTVECSFMPAQGGSCLNKG